MTPTPAAIALTVYGQLMIMIGAMALGHGSESPGKALALLSVGSLFAVVALLLPRAKRRRSYCAACLGDIEEAIAQTSRRPTQRKEKVTNDRANNR